MKLIANKRSVFGKKVKLLRRQNLVPGVIYGRHVEQPIAVAFDRVSLVKMLQKAGSNVPVEISGDGIDELVLFHDVQLDPVTDRVIHVDCLAVNKDEKVRAEVPVVLEGESPFEKNSLGRVQVLRNTLEVEALPMDLPREIKIDISSLTEDGMVIHISDIVVGEKVHLVGDPELTVLSTVAFASETEEESESEGEDADEGAEAPSTDNTEENKEG